MPERRDGFTIDQQRAIETMDRSVLVSAAAGSGKTTVLAERCAALLSAPPCRIDELLVVTFTDAAAGEMKSRIGGAIRKRLASRPNDRHLQQQLHLLDSASISTIHSFCKTLIQRWFPQAEIDPQSAVLSGEEAELLRSETLDALFVELYAGREGLAAAFQSLVDDYGGGEDRSIREVVLRVHEFINSLPDPNGWLDHAVAQVDPDAPDGLCAHLAEVQGARLLRELELQVEFGTLAAETIRHCWPVAEMHAEAIDEHVANLQRWHKALKATKTGWEKAAAEIRDFAFDRAAVRPRDLSDEQKEAFDRAKALRDRTKQLFCSRLQEACCLFTAAEYRDGLKRIAPHVKTLTELVRAFGNRYHAAKTAQTALDFNDLQRCAFKLLADGGDPQKPTEVARQLQRQYRYVLVDEFQDVDPLQESILRLVSRESANPPAGNLFTVGDIKQSIYRFRLAEPTLFTSRADTFDAGASLGTVIHLKENFRSRGSIIDAVNAIFAPLMSRTFGGSEYDQHARLTAAATYPATEADRQAFDQPAIELHLLEPITEGTRAGDEENGSGAPANGAGPAGCGSDNELELEGIEREALLIGRQIQTWRQTPLHVADKQAQPGGTPVLRPIAYRDIVILLRSTVHKALPIADVLRRMGIPVRVERDDASMDSTEFRDVLSLLQLLDNRQQDLPLAAVMRSPLLSAPLSESEMLEIRLAAPRAHFHHAAAEYARTGASEALRSKLSLLMSTLDRYRTLAQRAPLADVLWRIYEESNYLHYVAGLPDGARRREHLLRLHDLARQFGRFGKQGLRRFLGFLEELVASDRSADQPAGAADDDAVRIMSIHASKGLEFPLVILADLQKSFNLSDGRGTVLLDRQLGLAMRAADSDRRIMYPTLAHQLAGDRIRQESLSEELRVLYVALTRAREHLMLIGRVDPARVELQKQMQSTNQLRGQHVPVLQLETANCLLDWILPALATLPPESVRWGAGGRAASSALFEVFTYPREETDGWKVPPPAEPQQAEALAAIAALQPLPANEPLAAAAEVEPILAPLDFIYGGLELTTVPARVSVTELKRRWEAQRDPDERPVWPGKTHAKRHATRLSRPVFLGLHEDDARERGTATHRFLQQINLTRPCDAADLDAQCRELLEAGRLTTAEAGAIMRGACVWFFTTDLGQRVRGKAAEIRREFAFVSRIDPQDYDPLLAARDTRDALLIRGMVDVLLPGPEGLEIIDYKTDAISAEQCAARAAEYRPQVDLYARAMSAIYRQPVTGRRLVFLHARSIVSVD